MPTAGDGSIFSVKTIILAVDGSQNARKAADVAIAVAKTEGALLKVVAVNVIKRDATDIAGEDKAREEARLPVLVEDAVRDTVSAAQTMGVAADGKVVDTEGSVVDSILRYQEEQKGDLIVVGTRGLGGLKRMLVGSVSSGVAARANCSVLIVR